MNTKYYHASVKHNRAKKRIVKLKDDLGQDQFSEEAKGEVATAYFANLFKSANIGEFSELFEGFSARVTPTMNDSLSKDVSNAEVKEAVFSIKPGSAPGPDGMTGLFFQKYWGIVGDQVTKEVKDFFSSGLFPAEWNFTHLFFYPKD